MCQGVQQVGNLVLECFELIVCDLALLDRQQNLGWFAPAFPAGLNSQKILQVALQRVHGLRVLILGLLDKFVKFILLIFLVTLLILVHIM